MVHGRSIAAVSVPFRGSCSEIAEGARNEFKTIIVSVPFRGSCSEILVLQALILRGFKMLFAARIVFCPFPAATSRKNALQALSLLMRRGFLLQYNIKEAEGQ